MAKKVIIMVFTVLFLVLANGNIIKSAKKGECEFGYSFISLSYLPLRYLS